MILGFQIIALVFSLMMIYFAYLHYRRGEINSPEIIIWLVVWIGAVLIILFPGAFGSFSKVIAISRTFDLAVIGGFILVIPLVYISYIRTKKMEKKIEQLIRADALKEIRHGKNKKKTS